MTAIVCICDGGGMLFNNRRLSRDRLLMENLSAFIGDGALYISDFSERLFEKSDLCTIVASEPLDCAKKEDFVFVENQSLAQQQHLVAVQCRKFSSHVDISLSLFCILKTRSASGAICRDTGGHTMTGHQRSVAMRTAEGGPAI